MPFNVMLQICKITRSSKLFQRNFYLPLLKPLSPKDALRRHIITGKNLLGTRIEHYIPVLEEYQDRVWRRRYRVKGLGKKRQRRKANMRYVMPFFDSEMEHHDELQRLLATKAKGRGQCYTYYVPDKNCTLVIPFQMERAIRDRDILDVIMAQRSEKIVVKLKDGTKVTLPLVAYNGQAPFYRGEGWTKKEIEEYHHHGKETMSIARLFEAKEAGIEEWELEMMRMANKRKRKMKGEGTVDWKQMMASCVENMDWDKFEEETKQIVEQQNEPVNDEPINMAVDDMEKTKHVNEKLKAAGEEVLAKLPKMPEIPEIVKIMQDGEMTEMAEVSGMSLNLPSSGAERFVPGQIVKSEEGDMFVPGQTVEKENGVSEYTPGFTVMMDDEPTLLPGLVMGDDPNKPMFLPGDSTITESGELQFTENEDDIIERSSSSSSSSSSSTSSESPPPSEPEDELEEEQNSEEEKAEEEEVEAPPPPPPRRPKRESKEFVYERPKRPEVPVSMGPKRRERAPKKPQTSAAASAKLAELAKKAEESLARKKAGEPVLYDMTLPTFEKDLLLQQKERVGAFNEKKAKEEIDIDKKRRDIRMKLKQFMANRPQLPAYEPVEPVKKSEKLREFESSIKTGKFFDNDYKKYLVKDPLMMEPFKWVDSYEYRHTFDTVGILRHRVWKSVI